MTCNVVLVLVYAMAVPAFAAPVAAPPQAGPKVKVPANAEDCIVIDPVTVKADNAGGVWKVALGPTAALDYGADAASAKHAVDVIQHYHFTRQCFVRRNTASMMYWRNGVAVPPGNMPGEDCLAFHAASTETTYSAGGWKVMDGNVALLDYGQDRVGAETAATVIHTYNLNRECVIARPHTVMQYWLAE
jgi:hypothetical protein